MENKSFQTFAEIRQSLDENRLSVSSLVETYLKRIEKQQNLNAFLEVFKEEATQAAAQLDLKIKTGKAGRLAGMVIGVKDVISYKNHQLSASSHILGDFKAIYTATALQRLIDEDAIIIGRLNCDEFAMGGSNENSAYGKVLNPIDHSRVPGGSSGGSAVAVSAGLCHAALGSDTGGSVRQPASFCDIIGLKPTYGRISRHGLIAYASSFDQIGVFTNSIYDAALLLEIMAGDDEYDSTSSPEPVPAYSEIIQKDPDKKRIAYPKECLEHDGLDPEILDRMRTVIEELQQDGYTVEPVSFPYLDFLVPSYYILTTAEASSNLSRYGGILYGCRSKNATDLTSTFIKSRSEGFGTEVKRRIMLGTFVLSAGYYDSYYGRAQRIRRLITETTESILNQYDFILLPTTPRPAFQFGEKSDPVSMYLEDIFTVQANLAGLPAISLPIGKHSNGMPFGMQLMAKKYGEASLLSLSELICKKFRRLD